MSSSRFSAASEHDSDTDNSSLSSEGSKHLASNGQAQASLVGEQNVSTFGGVNMAGAINLQAMSKSNVISAHIQLDRSNHIQPTSLPRRGRPPGIKSITAETKRVIMQIILDQLAKAPDGQPVNSLLHAIRATHPHITRDQLYRLLTAEAENGTLHRTSSSSKKTVMYASSHTAVLSREQYASSHTAVLSREQYRETVGGDPGLRPGTPVHGPGGEVSGLGELLPTTTKIGFGGGVHGVPYHAKPTETTEDEENEEPPTKRAKMGFRTRMDDGKEFLEHFPLPLPLSNSVISNGHDSAAAMVTQNMTGIQLLSNTATEMLIDPPQQMESIDPALVASSNDSSISTSTTASYDRSVSNQRQTSFLGYRIGAGLGSLDGPSVPTPAPIGAGLGSLDGPFVLANPEQNYVNTSTSSDSTVPTVGGAGTDGADIVPTVSGAGTDGADTIAASTTTPTTASAPSGSYTMVIQSLGIEFQPIFEDVFTLVRRLLVRQQDISNPHIRPTESFILNHYMALFQRPGPLCDDPFECQVPKCSQHTNGGVAASSQDSHKKIVPWDLFWTCSICDKSICTSCFLSSTENLPSAHIPLALMEAIRLGLVPCSANLRFPIPCCPASGCQSPEMIHGVTPEKKDGLQIFGSHCPFCQKLIPVRLIPDHLEACEGILPCVAADCQKEMCYRDMKVHVQQCACVKRQLLGEIIMTGMRKMVELVEETSKRI